MINEIYTWMRCQVYLDSHLSVPLGFADYYFWKGVRVVLFIPIQAVFILLLHSHILLARNIVTSYVWLHCGFYETNMSPFLRNRMPWCQHKTLFLHSYLYLYFHINCNSVYIFYLYSYLYYFCNCMMCAPIAGCIAGGGLDCHLQVAPPNILPPLSTIPTCIFLFHCKIHHFFNKFTKWCD